MLFYIKIGLRNLLKNYRRSVKTIMIIVIGLSACLLSQGFMSHTLWGLRESLINGGFGHFQIYQKGYLEHPNHDSFQYMITNSRTIFQELKEIPGIKLVAPRLNFQGMISTGEKNAIFIGSAGQPQAERSLNSFATLKKGSFLRDNKPFGIVIGSGLARKLGVRVGDTVTLTTALKDGGINALDMEIIGIAEMQIKAYNDVVLLANLPQIQQFVNQPNAVDRITLLLTKTENLDKIKPYLTKLTHKLNLEFADWGQLTGKQYTQPKLFFDLVHFLSMAIIIMVVIFSITNTLNLTMQERIREIGTIRSLGTTQYQVGKIFIVESLLIGIIGGLLGIFLGYGLSAILNGLGGIPMPPPPGQARGFIALFKPDLVEALKLWLLFLITAAIGGVYPALRAARLQIVDALRWI